MGPESWQKASAQLGCREEDQPVVFPLLGFDGPSCKVMGELSSMDMSPWASAKEWHLFGWGDCVGSDLGEVAMGGHPCAWGTLADGMDGSDDDEFPSKIL